MSGVIDLGMVSRELKDGEKKALGEPQAYLVGKDAVAIAVNSHNPLAQRQKGRLYGERRFHPRADDHLNAPALASR
jgi:ABC-type phosphate transport system substrate-binding protein